MSIQGVILDGEGRGHTAKVNASGVLATGAAEYDQTKFLVLDLVATAYLFYPPMPAKQFVIRGIQYRADRDVATNADAELIVYEGTESDTTTVSRTLHQDALVRGENAQLFPLNILVNKGVWVLAKTSDDDIHMTIIGHYVDELT